MKNKDIAIIMGSDSDLEVMQDAAKLLDQFKVGYELTIVSAHRTPQRLYSFAKEAHEKGIKVIIAGAGGAAHLPGMTASLTAIPVIGVPINTKSMDGLDSLLSIVQMPPGIPVATVAVNGSKNAAILAVEILAISNPMLYKVLQDYKESLDSKVLEKVAELEKSGVNKYLSARRKQK